MSSYIKHSSWDENVMGQVSPEKPMITYLYWSEKNKKINKINMVSSPIPLCPPQKNIMCLTEDKPEPHDAE